MGRASERGWGATIFGVQTGGEWSKNFHDALQKGRVAINSLDIVGIIEAVEHDLRHDLIPRDGIRTVFRSESDVTCTTFNR